MTMLITPCPSPSFDVASSQDLQSEMTLSESVLTEPTLTGLISTGSMLSEPPLTQDPSLSFDVAEMVSPNGENSFDRLGASDIEAGLCCPWCLGEELHDLPSMVWCKCCEEPAWISRGDRLTRADQLDQCGMPWSD